mmetsp:Transcript_12913/g.8996  ORF Transcript_12913/g.8996 Transcript_12913/m.8996 type:complete len:113 (+) Transcript_12913:246-584(+)
MVTEAEIFDLGPMGKLRVEGIARPFQGLLPENTEFKIHFEFGGAAHFQCVYQRLLKRCRDMWNMDQVYGEFMGEQFRAEWGGFGNCDQVQLLVIVDQPVMMNPMGQERMVEN